MNRDKWVSKGAWLCDRGSISARRETFIFVTASRRALGPFEPIVTWDPFRGVERCILTVRAGPPTFPVQFVINQVTDSTATVPFFLDRTL
jgi:hypothetical protein